MGWTRDEVVRLYRLRDVAREEELRRMQEIKARCDTRPHGHVENVMPYDKQCGFRSGGEG